MGIETILGVVIGTIVCASLLVFLFTGWYDSTLSDDF